MGAILTVDGVQYPDAGNHATTLTRMNAGVLEKSTDGGATYSSLSGGTVTTDATLTGAGTGGSPLGVNPVAARAPDPRGYFANLFQQRTGLSPLQMSIYENDFHEFSRVANSNTTGGQGGVQSGTGASVAYVSTVGGGILLLSAPSSGAGFADWNNGGASAFKTITNLRTKRWLVAYRWTPATAPSSASRVVAGVWDGTNIVGIGYSGAQSHYQYCKGTNATNITDLGKSIDSTGNAFLWMYIANFDLVNIVGTPDVVGAVAETNFDVVASVANGMAQPYFWNEGTGVTDQMRLDMVVMATERA